MNRYDDMKSVRLRITGRVQGVWYRTWTVEAARRYGLDGWVRNRRDGSVEALLSGSDDQVEKMIAACRDGPPSAIVKTVEIEEADPPKVPGFKQLASF
jgi:acylphosphatase